LFSEERRDRVMKTIQVDIPEKLVNEIEEYVKEGWFNNEGELMREALREFIRHHRPMLMEKYMEEDIEWALKVKRTLDS
jgi:Arc/MetJ-type ribon-helix-helix transcriptional regulator